MADGYARSSRTLAVVMTIGGPGSNNLITAVNTARIERVPLLIITGDVPIQLYDKMAFQCSTYLGTNDDALYRVAAKWSRRVSNADQFPDLLHEAVSSALSYPQGPSHLIIPYDIQQTPLSSKILSNSEERHLSFNQSELFNGTFETTLQRVQNLLSSNVHIRLKKNGVRKLDTTEIRELDVVGFAKSMGAAAYRVTSLSEFQSRVTQALGTNQVTVLDVPTSITPRIPEGVPFFSIYA